MMMVTATSCDNKQAQGTDKNIAQDSLAPGVIVASDTVAPDSTTPDSATANLTEYVNAKYGYQVKVPAQMRCTDRPPMAEGANYALGGDDVMNMMSLFCSENYGGKAFTPSEKERRCSISPNLPSFSPSKIPSVVASCSSNLGTLSKSWASSTTSSIAKEQVPRPCFSRDKC